MLLSKQTASFSNIRLMQQAGWLRLSSDAPVASRPLAGRPPCAAARPEREHLRGASSPTEARSTEAGAETGSLTCADSFRKALTHCCFSVYSRTQCWDSGENGDDKDGKLGAEEGCSSGRKQENCPWASFTRQDQSPGSISLVLSPGPG